MALTVKNLGGGGGSKKFPMSIYVAAPPTKTKYTAGEKLDLTGLKVMVKYVDETEQDITDQCTVSPEAGTTLYENNTEILIAWDWEGIASYQTTQAISVSRVLQSIAITTPPSKATYYKGDTLSIAGMVVTATYTSGLTEDVTKSCSASPAAGTALTEFGNVAVTVTYIENGVTKTASFQVTVTVNTVTWATGTDQQIADMVAAADAGIINLQDYWAVGQERKVSLAAMAKGDVGETHVAQTVTMVLMNAGGKTLANGKTCSFIAGLKNGLANGTNGEYGYMNPTDTNSGGWKNSKRRAWCNATFRNSIPAAIRPIFKQFKNKSCTGGGSSSGTEETTDWFALPAEIEVFGSTTYSVAGEGTQFQWYKTAANRIKKNGDRGSASGWWERSPNSGNSNNFCNVNSDGSANNNNASNTYLLSPFGCYKKIEK